jgi:ERCC4-type nuclease
MILSIDERETSLFARCSDRLALLESPNIILEKRMLLLGDASISAAETPETNICIFERKTLADLAASIKDGRYAEQSHRLTHASNLHTHNIVYVIEGPLAPVKAPARARAISAMVSLALFKGFNVTRTTSVDETAELMLSAAIKIAKNKSKGEFPRFSFPAPALTPPGTEYEPAAAEIVPSYATVVNRVKKDNVTTENFFEIVLVQIPGVSANIAALVAARAGTLTELAAQLRANPTYLDDVRVSMRGSAKTRRIGTNVVAAIHKFVLAL